MKETSNVRGSDVTHWIVISAAATDQTTPDNACNECVRKRPNFKIARIQCCHLLILIKVNNFIILLTLAYFLANYVEYVYVILYQTCFNAFGG